MKAPRPSFIRIVLCLATFSASLRADEAAEQLLETARARAAEMGSGELDVVTRELTLTDLHTSKPREMGRDAYQRLLVTWRPPGDWRLAFKRESKDGSHTYGAGSYVFSKVGEDAGMLTLSAEDNERVELKLPPKIFFQEARQRIGPLMNISVLTWTPGWPQRPGAAPAGAPIMSEATLGVSEVVNGVVCQRVDGFRPPMRVSFWVNKSTGHLVRSREMRDPRESMGRPSFVEVTETVYSYAPEKGRQNADFDLVAGWSLMQAGLSSTAGLANTDDLGAWAREGMSSSGGSDPGTRRRTPGERDSAPSQPLRPGEAPVAGAPSTQGGKSSATTPKTPAPVEAQSLNAEQMAAVVLVEGEGGVGSGFITKIRDLPFVVTNVHVIGGNEKIRVTTLTGAKVEVGATHAAIGRDLAIMRIEGTPPAAFLTLAANPLQTAKIGDKVVVVGNRRGGGVATQVSGVVQGVGPDKIEVDAAFQPGNSGSPIVHVESGEVIGLAAYSQTRKLDMLDGVPAKSGSRDADEEAKIEQRWFGYRVDGVSGWQTIDLARWRQQTRRIEAFRKDSEALYYALLGKFDQTNQSPSVHSVVERFQQRFVRAGSGQVQAAQDVVEYFRSLRALTENGKKELRDGDYYDYFRTSLYWETSIPEQLRTREQLAKYLEQAAENTTAFLSRLRN
jgi:S1-C subfamily serine protease